MSMNGIGFGIFSTQFYHMKYVISHRIVVNRWTGKTRKSVLKKQYDTREDAQEQANKLMKKTGKFWNVDEVQA
jgi:hypothetical protein